MSPDQLSDEELVSRFRSGVGDPRSNQFVNELFRRHRTRVACWCLRMTGDRESAADLAQEIFANAWRRLDSYRGDSKFSTWLYAITRNHCLNQMRARASRPDTGAGELTPDLQDTTEGPLERLEREDTLRVMRELMKDALDETERKVLALHYAQEMPLDAITRLLGLTNPSGAKAYIVSARRKLIRAAESRKARSGNGNATTQ